MKNLNNNGICAGGGDSYLKALRVEEREAIEEIRKLLRAENDKEAQQSLKAQIKTIKLEYKKKRKSIGGSLFMR